MRSLNQKTLAVTTAAILGLGVTGAAHAGAKAFSSLIIDNFIIANNDTGAQLSAGDFSILEVGDSGRNSASLDGDTAGPNIATRGDLPLGALDAELACAGPGIDCESPGFPTISENDFTQQPILQQFARADSLLTGAIITEAGASSSATASQVAEVQINADQGTGASDAVVATGTRFEFSLSTSVPVAFQFNADTVLHTLLQQPDQVATAGRSFVIAVRDVSSGATLFRWVPDGLSGNITGGVEEDDPFSLTTSITTLSEDEAGPIANSAFFRAVSQPLLANNPMTLTIQSTTSANATVVPETVPEPATLALLSAGLLGMGAASRRRKGKDKV